jgi:hypothetical protein
MAESLLRGDVLGAWLANPLAVVVATLVAARSVGWIVELVRDPQRLPRRWLPASWHRHWFSAFVVVSCAYVLVRNLVPLG